MRRIYPEQDWCSMWKATYLYDLEEVYGEHRDLGYAYSYAQRHDFTIQALTEVLPPGSRILDIAAAQGNFSLALAELGYEVTWNDLRADMIDYVKMKHEKGNVSYVAGNAFELEFSHLFDGVVITEIIEHVAHPDQFLANTARLVRPGGYIIMTTPNGQYFRNDLPKFSECEDPSAFESVQFKANAGGHIFLLHKDEVEEFAGAVGLQINRFALFNNPLTSGHLKLSKLLQRLPKSAVDACERMTQQLPAPVAARISMQMGVLFQKPLNS